MQASKEQRSKDEMSDIQIGTFTGSKFECIWGAMPRNKDASCQHDRYRKLMQCPRWTPTRTVLNIPPDHTRVELIIIWTRKCLVWSLFEEIRQKSILGIYCQNDWPKSLIQSRLESTSGQPPLQQPHTGAPFRVLSISVCPPRQWNCLAIVDSAAVLEL